MKNILILFISIVCYSFPLQEITAQTAEGGCTSVSIIDMPSFPSVYATAFPGLYRPCPVGGDPCLNPEFECCLQHLTGPPPQGMSPRSSLQRQNLDGTWSQVGGFLFGVNPTFTNLTTGTYRVLVTLPTFATDRCCPRGTEVRTQLFALNGAYLGYVGTYATPIFSNNVLVGPSTITDNSYTFIDIPETGAEIAYDFGETVKMDISNSRHYDQWWLAIIETSPPNRYKTIGWQFGTIAGDEYDLSQFWDPNEFETFNQYNVQFVIENSKCRNGIEFPNPAVWNENTQVIFLCPKEAVVSSGLMKERL